MTWIGTVSNKLKNSNYHTIFLALDIAESPAKVFFMQ